MLLSTLKHTIKSQKEISLTKLSIDLKEDRSVIYMMLQQLIHKGYISKQQTTTNCGSHCNRCDPLSTLIVSWVN